ncbi:MAG: cytochrome b5 reductase family protein [Candidatus Woesearchaeota archaeon]
MGTFSSELYQLKEGDSLIVNGPLGECFNVTSFSEEDFIFLSGGTGVTPFISIFKFLQDKKMNNKVTMINANKTYDDIIMRERLDTLSQDDKYFIMNTLDSADDSWGGERGFISKEMIEKYVQNYADKRFLICGPPPMVASLRAVLKELGVADENVCFDNWQLPGKSQKEN